MDVVEQQQQQKQDSEIIMTAINPGYSFEWNELLFETKAPYIFHDTKLNLERELFLTFGKMNLIFTKIFISLIKIFIILLAKDIVYRFF